MGRHSDRVERMLERVQEQADDLKRLKSSLEDQGKSQEEIDAALDAEFARQHNALISEPPPYAS